MPISEKRLRANRLNAQKGGVKTDEGKAISRFNAMKHGILSEAIVLDGVAFAEDAETYDDLRKRFFEEYSPVGITEFSLVDRLVSSYWRLLRVPRAECAAIERNVADSMLRHDLEQVERVVQYRHTPLRDQRQFRASLVAMHIQEFVWFLQGYIKHHGLPLPNNVVEALENDFSSGHDLPHVLTIFLANNTAEQAQRAGEKELLKTCAEDALEAANKLEQLIDVRIRCWRQWEVEKDCKEMEAQLIPDEKEAEKIQRYESHLHRMFMQTLHELQRIQSKRLGEAPPLAAALDITAGNENGFVS